MQTEKTGPIIVSLFVLCTGLLFMAAGVVDLSFLRVKPAGEALVLVFSGILILFALFSLYRIKRDGLASRGMSITEVRQEAIEKIKDKTLLAKMAKEDPNDAVREAAAKRLQGIH